MTEQLSRAERLEQRYRRGASQFLAVDIVVLCFLLAMTIGATPKFKEIFEAMVGSSMWDGLPLITVCFLTVPAPAYFLTFTGAIIGLVFADKLQPDERKRHRVNLIVFWVSVLIVAAYVVAMLLPVTGGVRMMAP